MHIWRPFVLWFGARTPAFFRSKKRSFGFHGLQRYEYHTLPNCIAQIWKMLILTHWYHPSAIGTDPSIRRFCCHPAHDMGISTWTRGHRGPNSSSTATFPGAILATLEGSCLQNGMGWAAKRRWILPPFWSGFYKHHVLVSWFVIGKSSNLLFFGESSHSWYRWKTLEKTFWKLSTWNESLVRKNMSQTKWLLLVSTNFNQWLGS